MTESSLELCCRVLLEAGDLPEPIRYGAQELLRDPESEVLTLALVSVLFQSRAYNAAAKILESQRATTPSFDVAQRLLLAASYTIADNQEMLNGLPPVRALNLEDNNS